MRGFQVLFEAYGAVCQIKMSRFLNNEGMYLRLLGMLFQDETPVKLGEALEKLVEPLRGKEKRNDYLTLYGEIKLEFQGARAFWEELKGVGQI